MDSEMERRVDDEVRRREEIEFEVRRREALSHLNILSIVFYIQGALTFCTGFAPIFHTGIGAMIFGVGTAGAAAGKKEAAGMMIMGGLFFVIGGSVMLCFWIQGALLAFTGRSLQTRRRYTFCFVMACIALMNFPIGTAMGIFTIITLQKPFVKELFEATAQNIQIDTD